MNCPRCQTQNESHARFCRSCGCKLHTDVPSNNRTSDILLLVFIFIALFCGVFQMVITKFVDDWYTAPIKYVYGVVNLFQNFSLILVPLALKDKTFKIIGIVLAVIMALYWSYTNIEFMIG